ncbi:thymidine phosphorylase family protein [Flavobacterium frigoris]|uniref:thymidine phosphorylase n=1 Tax=Flavobacterium frigoris TaxID=229204 RepID=A0A1H9JYY2_FLAFI|nr:thymidine phosphorylase family protein [Flavobacterium frigoris]SEQ92017.1 thymidine phosphorylase [Flavobacterium frigoris]
MNTPFNTLKLVHLGIDTQREHVVFMRKDCHICISEGFEALNRVLVTVKGKSKIATLYIINDGILNPGEAGLSESAWGDLNAKEGDEISFSHVQPVNSMRSIRAKMYGQELNYESLQNIINDIVKGEYSNIEIAAFITACGGDSLSIDEIIGLTKAMVVSGQRLSWNKKIVVDKHCVGGLPGNRTTPIVVAIIAAFGLTIPKTSSRAITSPAGTADSLETMTKIDLSIKQIQKVVEQENGCFVWGGSIKLSPADDILIRVERALDVDGEGQMIASVLSKKIAAGSTHVVIDIPIGKTAKVRTEKDAEKLKYYFNVVGKAMGINVNVLFTDGSQPIGRGIGPALEAMDVLSVLRNEKDAPQDLRNKSLLLAASIIEMVNGTKNKSGLQLAKEILSSGEAYAKFMAICQAQGGFKEPEFAPYKEDVKAEKSGIVTEIDNRRLAKIAKLAGAPHDSKAGVLLKTPLNTKVQTGDVLYCIYSETKGELKYSIDYMKSEEDIILIQ